MWRKIKKCDSEEWTRLVKHTKVLTQRRQYRLNIVLYVNVYYVWHNERKMIDNRIQVQVYACTKEIFSK